jgi:uncharacterized protein (DUF433 family)
MLGKPVIRDTRIAVEQILRKLAAGMGVDEILADHPHLTPDDVYAAAACAADYMAQEEIVFAGVDETFAKQVAEFIEQYRPALETLAR